LTLSLLLRLATTAHFTLALSLLSNRPAPAFSLAHASPIEPGVLNCWTFSEMFFAVLEGNGLGPLLNVSPFLTVPLAAPFGPKSSLFQLRFCLSLIFSRSQAVHWPFFFRSSGEVVYCGAALLHLCECSQSRLSPFPISSFLFLSAFRGDSSLSFLPLQVRHCSPLP